MVRALTTAVLVAITLSLAMCQTFQYSRGWTNGKRSESSSPLASILDFKAAIEGTGSMNDLQARCANLRKWKTFLRSSDNEEVCRVPCEFLDVLRQCLRQDKVSPVSSSSSSSSDFRRPSAPALESSSSF